MQQRKRFNDENLILSNFFNEGWVICRSCAKKAMSTVIFETKITSSNEKKCAFLLLFCLSLLQGNAQNLTLIKKEMIDEFRTQFVQKVQIQSGCASKHKNIDFSIDACSIQIKTIDYENSYEENVSISLPLSGAILKESGEIYYETKAIKEVIENKISKQITTNFYSNSNEIGLFLKLENEEKHKEMQERIKELSSFCGLEKN